MTGGLSGVMEAVSRGAKNAGGLVIGILPGLDKRDANAYVDVAITPRPLSWPSRSRPVRRQARPSSASSAVSGAILRGGCYKHSTTFGSTDLDAAAFGNTADKFGLETTWFDVDEEFHVETLRDLHEGGERRRYFT